MRLLSLRECETAIGLVIIELIAMSRLGTWRQREYENSSAIIFSKKIRFEFAIYRLSHCTRKYLGFKALAMFL